MTMKDMFFESAGDMFALEHFPALRPPEEFGRAASSMGFRNTEVADGMLFWSAALPISLTKVSVRERQGADGFRFKQPPTPSLS